MEADTKESNIQNISGLATFFSYVDADELLSSAEVVQMPTLLNVDVSIVLVFVLNSKVRPPGVVCIT